MNIDSYIETAKSRILCVPQEWTGNKFYLRNRIADLAVYLLSHEPENWAEFYEYSRPDVIQCQDRANHYGVKIGDTLKTASGADKMIRKPKADFHDRYAKHLRIVKNTINVNEL